MPKKRNFEIAPLPFEVSASLEALGRRIALTRKERKQSQRNFADVMGIAPATMVAIERGSPSVQIGHYARALWLLEIQDTLLGNFGLPEIRVTPFWDDAQR
jgi:transcriptional regulator with XRE-family HTH domain